MIRAQKVCTKSWDLCAHSVSLKASHTRGELVRPNKKLIF